MTAAMARYAKYANDQCKLPKYEQETRPGTVVRRDDKDDDLGELGRLWHETGRKMKK